MAPLTRSRAEADASANELMLRYYEQRASAGLIVSEGIVVSPQGASYRNVPGLFSDAHIAPWSAITEAVHRRGGLIVAQLWHVGRQSHSSVQPDGAPPGGPSAVPITGYSYYARPDKLRFETPRALSTQEIRAIVGDFAAAARRAIMAGFDGVEIHGANGYLIDQFLHRSANRRTDAYGGGPAGRSRFLHEVLEAVSVEVPTARIGVRLSPSSTWMDVDDADKPGLFSHVVSSLSGKGLGYLHLVEPNIAGATDASDAAPVRVDTSTLRPLFDGALISTGGHGTPSAETLLAAGTADLIGFGRPFIANPDLVERISGALPWATPQPRTFYSGGAEGYTSYPAYA
jgi:N-ethylmaleimide reductase